MKVVFEFRKRWYRLVLVNGMPGIQLLNNWATTKMLWAAQDIPASFRMGSGVFPVTGVVPQSFAALIVARLPLLAKS